MIAKKRISILLTLMACSLGLTILVIGMLQPVAAEINSVSPTLTPVPPVSQTVQPNQTVTYTHLLSHTSATTETIEIGVVSAAGATFLASLISPLTVTVPPSTTTGLTVTVTAPPLAISGTQEVITVTATLSNVVATTTNTTTVGLLAAPLAAYPPQASDSGLPNTPVTYTYLVTNGSNITDTVQLVVSNEPFTDSLSTSELLLSPFGSDSFTLTVFIPAYAPFGEEVTHTVTLTPSLAGVSPLAITATTHVSEALAVTVTQTETAASMGNAPGDYKEYLYTVINEGNSTRDFDLSFAFTDGLNPQPQPSNSISLDAGASLSHTVGFTVPMIVQGTIYTTALTASTGNISDMASTTMSVSQGLRPLTIVPPQDTHVGLPGAEVIFTHVITNNSNVTDTVQLALSDELISGDLFPTTLELAPFTGEPFTLTVAIPNGTLAGQLVTHLITATSTFTDVLPIVVTDTTQVEEVLGVSVTQEQTDNSGGNNPNAIKEYRYTVTNESNSVRTFDLVFDFTDGLNPQPLPPISEMLMAGESVTYTTAFIVPVAPQGTVYTTSLTATTTTTTSVATDMATTTMTVGQRAGVLLVPDLVAQSGLPGAVVTYTLTVTNDGNATDTFALELATANYPAEVIPSSVTLARDESTSITVRVTVPTDALADTSAVVTVTATSQSDSSVTASATVTTTVLLVSSIVVTPLTDTRSGAPGQDVTYTHLISNTSNGALSLTLVRQGNEYPTTLNQSSLIIPYQQNALITVTVSIPANAQEEDEDVMQVLIRDAHDNVLATIIDTTTVEMRRVYLPLIVKPQAPPPPPQWEKFDDTFTSIGLDVAICQNDKTTGFLATENGLRELQNGKWTVVDNDLPTGTTALVASLALASDCQTAYVGFVNAGVWQGELSDDEWDWTKIGNEAEFENVWSVAYAQDTLLVSGAFGINFKQGNNDWVNVPGASNQTPVTSLSISGDRVYAVQFGLNKAIYAPLANPTQWAIVPGTGDIPDLQLRSIVGSPNGSFIYVGGQNGYYRSSGNQWEKIESVGTFALANNDEAIFSGHTDGEGVSQIEPSSGFVTSLDSGWVSNKPATIYGLFILEGGVRDEIYAATSEGVWVYGHLEE